MENVLWNVFANAEVISFFLVWIVVPLLFVSLFIFLRKVSSPAGVPLDGKAPPASNQGELLVQPVLSVKEKKVNVNEANA